MKVFEIKNCIKKFNNEEVLYNVSAYINEGEFLSIIGSSGSGRLTLLRCSTLLEQMDSGSLYYMGELAVNVSLNDYKSGEYIDYKKMKHIKSYFGLVFQNFNLFPH